MSIKNIGILLLILNIMNVSWWAFSEQYINNGSMLYGASMGLISSFLYMAIPFALIKISA